MFNGEQSSLNVLMCYLLFILSHGEGNCMIYPIVGLHCIFVVQPNSRGKVYDFGYCINKLCDVP